MKSKQNILTSLGFLTGLFLLLLNDFYLKSHFGNWWTGKLSDFAGLFIFPIFLTVLFPKYKKQIYCCTALLFVFWKSPFSQIIIDTFDAIPGFTISRTVDISDNIALLVLPFSYLYLEARNKTQTAIQPIVIFMVASFAFCATSYYSKSNYEKNYQFDVPIDTLTNKLYRIPTIRNFYENNKLKTNIDSIGTEPYELYVHDTVSNGTNSTFRYFNAKIIVSGDSVRSAITLQNIKYTDYENTPNASQILLESFEKTIIDKLK